MAHTIAVGIVRAAGGVCGRQRWPSGWVGRERVAAARVYTKIGWPSVAVSGGRQRWPSGSACACGHFPCAWYSETSETSAGWAFGCGRVVISWVFPERRFCAVCSIVGWWVGAKPRSGGSGWPSAAAKRRQQQPRSGGRALAGAVAASGARGGVFSAGLGWQKGRATKRRQGARGAFGWAGLEQKRGFGLALIYVSLFWGLGAGGWKP